MVKSEVIIDKDKLEQFTTNTLLAVGIDRKYAEIIGRHLVLANLRGVDSHGVCKVGIYVERLEKGIVNKDIQFTINRETPVSALLDAENSLGIAIATEGIRLAVDKAKKSGVGIIGIKNSNHCGMLADYLQYAAQNDCIAMATTNAPAVMAPWGGRQKFFGTNPFSYAIPAGKEIDIICDMATSIVAKGKIVMAAKNNESIPLGWAITKEGKPTTNPNEAIDGLILPMGGPKGYGITFLVEVLSGLMTGAAFGPYIGDLFTQFEQKQNVGHFFFVMRADLFQELEEFKEKIDQVIEEIRSVSLMEGVEKIYLPGEIELEKVSERSKNGISLPESVVQELIEIAGKYDLPHPFKEVFT